MNDAHLPLRSYTSCKRLLRTNTVRPNQRGATVLFGFDPHWHSPTVPLALALAGEPSSRCMKQC